MSGGKPRGTDYRTVVTAREVHDEDGRFMGFVGGFGSDGFSDGAEPYWMAELASLRGAWRDPYMLGRAAERCSPGMAANPFKVGSHACRQFDDGVLDEREGCPMPFTNQGD